MKSPWNDRSSDDPEYAIKRSYAKDAYLSDCWIYCEYNGNWYTPEEFMASTLSITISRGKDDREKFKIRDPKMAYIKHTEDIRKILEYNDKFYKKMVDYFNFKHKNKK